MGVGEQRQANKISAVAVVVSIISVAIGIISVIYAQGAKEEATLARILAERISEQNVVIYDPEFTSASIGWNYRPIYKIKNYGGRNASSVSGKIYLFHAGEILDLDIEPMSKMPPQFELNPMAERVLELDNIPELVISCYQYYDDYANKKMFGLDVWRVQNFNNIGDAKI